MPGPAFCAASAVSTKMPVPMIAPMPSIMRCTPPSERSSVRFFAVARMSSSALTRQVFMKPAPAILVVACCSTPVAEEPRPDLSLERVTEVLGAPAATERGDEGDARRETALLDGYRRSLVREGGRL